MYIGRIGTDYYVSMAADHSPGWWVAISVSSGGRYYDKGTAGIHTEKYTLWL